MVSLDPRRHLGDDDDDFFGMWDPSPLEEEARVPTDRDDVTREFERVAVSLDATDEQLEALHTLRDRPVHAAGEGLASAPGQVGDAARDAVFQLPAWLKGLLFLGVFALLAGQIGKLFDFRVR